MASLSLFDGVASKAILSSGIGQVFETKVFYIYRGRNAWHATWATHYSDACMHDSWASAKERAEDLRERGSVFTIREKPALAFKSEKGILAITEINARVPLAAWITNYRSEKSNFSLNQNHCRLETLIASRCTLGGIVSALGDRSIFPPHLPSRNRNIFTLWTPDRDALIENRRRRTKQWRSSSAGADFYLDWIDEPGKESGRAVRRVADALSPRITGD